MTNKKFILPEKWCIKATKTTAEVISAYFSSITHLYEGYAANWLIEPGCYCVFPQKSIGCWGYTKKPDDYTEITFKQFREHVLKDTMETTIPQNKFDIGAIIDTDVNGYQYVDMDRLSDDPKCTKKRVVDCNCKTIVKKNLKVLDKAYSQYTGNWWYKVEDYGNWISEDCMSSSESQFRAGMWYYYEHYNPGDDAYYLKAENSERYCEYIHIRSKTHCPQRSLFPISSMHNIRKADLSEIQQYLPDGHVDKVKVIPEYVRCTLPFSKQIKRNIYKVFPDGYVEDNKGSKSTFIWNGDGFEKSTKEAYDAQFEAMKTNQFKKGDYIVTLKVQDDSMIFNCARNNYCFKQREDCDYISPVLDLSGDKYNAHGVMSFDKKGYLQNWRYATLEEIAEYNRLGKPYEVTKLNKKEDTLVFDKFPIGTVVVSLNKVGNFRNEGDLFKVLPNSKPHYFYYLDQTHSSNPSDWRAANEEEIQAFDNGITNINKMVINPEVKEHLLEEAKCRYPVGTKFRCLVTQEVYSMPKNITFKHGETATCSKDIYSYVKGGLYHKHYDGESNTWAEIIQPEVKPNEYQFEVGKWYKNSPGAETYAKCLKPRKSSFEFREWITQGNYEMINISSWGSHSSMREASLYEIQEFLPEGHVDKLSKTTGAKPHEYTAEEALAELKRRGFKKDVDYVYMSYDGRYHEYDTRIARSEPRIVDSGRYIDCGGGYLWHIDNPSHLHRGPISGPTVVYNQKEVPNFQVNIVYEFSPGVDYSKPETLLPKTTLNY